MLALMGDGGIMFTIAELAAAAQLRLPLPVVVVDNAGYGEIRDQMAERGDPVHAVDLDRLDFAALGRALGCEGVFAARPGRPGGRPRAGLQGRPPDGGPRRGRLMDAYRSPLRPDANAGLVALVSGGGTGIGRATALELARSGARVAVCGRREEPLRAVRGEIEEGGGECLDVAADLREPEQVERVVGAALERFGTIDVLVNNAGGQFSAPAEEISDGGWRAVGRVTVDAVWSMTRAVATRAMIPARGGLIVFIGFSPLRGIPGFAHAAAGRAAVVQPRFGAGARVEPPPHPHGLRRARDDPHRGPRGLRRGGAGRLGAVGAARAPRPSGGGGRPDRLPGLARGAPTSPGPRSWSTAEPTPGAWRSRRRCRRPSLSRASGSRSRSTCR